MNGEIKWHKATGPAFAPGEQWEGSGGHRVTIVSVRKYPGAKPESNHTSDFGVTYEWVELSGTLYPRCRSANIRTTVSITT